MEQKTLKLLVIGALCLMALQLQSQVTIGDGTPPRDFSVLEVSTATTKGGLRLPRLSTQERNDWRDYFLGTATGNPVKPSVTFESSAATPNTATTGDIITYQATITFGPAQSYTWTTGNGTILSGGGINDNYAVVQYGAAGSPAFVQVVVANACGAGTGRRDVASVSTDCREADLTTLYPSTDQYKSVKTDSPFTLGHVAVSFGSAQVAYQWYRNTVKSTAGGSALGTSNTLVTSESNAGTYYYYCVMSNNNCGAAPVTSPFYTVTVTNIPSTTGTGNFTGKTCRRLITTHVHQGGKCLARNNGLLYITAYRHHQ